MSDYDDYENNLAFKPIGDWADTEPKVNTDRTQSSLDLVDKIEELTKWLDLKSEYIVKLEAENFKLKWRINFVRDSLRCISNQCNDYETQKLINNMVECLGGLTDD